MSIIQRVGAPRLSVVIPNRKHDAVDFDQSTHSSNGGNLSPDLQPATPPTYPLAAVATPIEKTLVEQVPQASKVGNYILVQQTDTVGDIQVFRAFHCDTQEEYICKVVSRDLYLAKFSAYFTVGHHEHINVITEIIHGATKSYVLFPRHYGDLHSYVRRKRRLREAEAGRLFLQIISAVEHCHAEGVVLRDLKLRKFVFKNVEKTELKLESLEDAFVLDDENNDCLADKHGCPAYVSPEILNCQQSYSGRAADMWSAGVMLYTLLIGRYPFHDVEPNALFTKIRRGDYRVPETVSSRAKCLIRSLLRKEPSQRLTAEQVIQHPWFCYGSRIFGHSSASLSMASTSLTSSSATAAKSNAAMDCNDHCVPQMPAAALAQQQEDFL